MGVRDTGNVPSAPLLIDTQSALATFCAQLRGQPWLALDTEFVRERTYYPKLCLIQVATVQELACIDPLAVDNLGPLYALLDDSMICKVLHAGRQDLEIFFHQRGQVPQPLFDTQIAAAMLGQGEQIGYAALVEALIDVRLPKSQTRTDWQQRPLSAQQLAYAVDDVYYLGQVYQQQCLKLQDLQRLDWVLEDSQALADPALYRLQPEVAWHHVKGRRKLRGVSLAVLKALAGWREQAAAAADVPKRWLIGDSLLLELARVMPASLDDLRSWSSIKRRFIRDHGADVVRVIASAREQPRVQWPVVDDRLVLNPQQEALLNALQALLRSRAAEYHLDVSVLGSRKHLQQWVTQGEPGPFAQGWRARLLGDELQQLINVAKNPVLTTPGA